jgi:hypothetical protein
MKLVLAAIVLFIAGTFLGSRFLAIPLRSFSVDNQGNQHCAGLRHGEHFEVFCLSTERPAGESLSRNADKWARETGQRFLPPPQRQLRPASEDYRAPWYGER